MKKTVFISAGHGAADSGAVSGQYTEAALMVELRNLVAAKLRAHDVTVTTDGEGKTNLPLKEAIKLAQKSDIAVELHLNAAASNAAGGVECLSLVERKPLAQALAGAIAAALQIKMRGGDHGWKSDSSGQHHRLGFCREGKGIIAEVFFLSNPTELKYYLENKDLVAQVIADILAVHAIA